MQPLLLASAGAQATVGVPWHMFGSPSARWAELPSFVVGEYLFIALAAIALWHASRSGRSHLVAWSAALIAGTANDLIFMALPLVDNFWHAQATLMLTPRLPVYIPCVYVCFMYLPTVAAWRLGMRGVPRAALTGLAAILFYAPFDIVGAKLLWWTWHDTDMPIAHRILGAPMGSTMWVITFAASFAWLLGRVVDRDPAMRSGSIAKGLLLPAAFSTLLMMVQMTALQPFGGGIPGPVPLALLIAGYAALSVWGVRSATPQAPRGGDRVVAAALTLHLLAHVAIILAFDPTTHRSTSMHQTYGACHVEAKDITGLTRYEFLCAEDFDEDFSFDCVDELPAEGDAWYTVCGVAHTNKAMWVGGVSTLVAAALAVFGWMLGVPPFRRHGA